jgi:5-formyltetrahydrofolate cyclo-ligase
MPSPKATTKARLRQELCARLQLVSPADRQSASAELCNRLLDSDIWRKASAILGFAPLPDELDIWPALLGALPAKTVALPWYDRASDSYAVRIITDPAKDLVPGNYGIREPSPACPKISLIQLDVALVPGVGYNKTGVRLGRGKGYYDRLLAGFPGVKCGIGYDWQVGLPIPAEEHDVHLNCILTPTRLHWCRSAVLE